MKPWQPARPTGRPAALAIIVAAVGSTPQKTGAKMLVKADGSTVGTVGGGEVEAQVIRAALEVLDAAAPRLLDLELTEAAGHLCGGRLQIYLEPVVSPPPLIIVGAGHVGLALAALAGFVGYRVTLADDREVPLPPGLAHTTLVTIESYDRPFAGLTVSPQAAIVIATRGHHHDLEALAAALRTPAVLYRPAGERQKEGGHGQRPSPTWAFPTMPWCGCTPPWVWPWARSAPKKSPSVSWRNSSRYRRNHAPKDFGPPAGRRLIDPDGAA